MEETYIWLTMSYSLPVNPSANRVFVWRKLRELGACLRQGAAFLPQSRQNRQQLVALAARVRVMGGRATVAELRFVDEQDNRTLVEDFKSQSRKEYDALLTEMLQLCDHNRQGNTRVLLKRMEQARRRDFFDARQELELDKLPPATRLLDGLELDLDGGFAELMRDLRQGYLDIKTSLRKEETKANDH